MGDGNEFHFGKRRSREGIEFVSHRKVQRFNTHARAASATSKAHEHTPPQDNPFEPIVQMQPAEAVLPAQPSGGDPLAHIYEEPLLTGPSQPIQLTQPMQQPTTALAQVELQAPKTSQIAPMIDLDDEAAPVAPSVFRRVLSYVFALVFIAVLAASILFLRGNTPNIPSAMVKKVGFPVYDIQKNPTFVLDKDSVEIGSDGNLVYFVDNVKTKAHFVVSQQKIPDVVSNDTDFKQFLKDFDKYAEMQSPLGTAYFTHPENIGNDISVVVKTGTSLMFIRGPGATSEADWSHLLNVFKLN